jgi:hypothetical protein
MPWMSLRIVKRLVSKSVTSPIATPATGLRIGTPASMSASVLPQTLAIEVEPFELKTSETSRMVYGNSSSLGITASSARSASAPWPISRRLGPRSRRTSPTLKGGKL